MSSRFSCPGLTGCCSGSPAWLAACPGTPSPGKPLSKSKRLPFFLPPSKSKRLPFCASGSLPPGLHALQSLYHPSIFISTSCLTPAPGRPARPPPPARVPSGEPPCPADSSNSAKDSSLFCPRSWNIRVSSCVQIEFIVPSTSSTNISC